MLFLGVQLIHECRRVGRYAGRSSSQSKTYPHRSSLNTSSNSSSSSVWHPRHSADLCATGFDACKVSVRLFLKEGYVSFADAQGLGCIDDGGHEYDGEWLLGLLSR